MQTVIVTHMDQAKSGKARVYFDGKNDWKDAYYVSTKIDVPPQGARIEVDTSSKVYEGKTYWYLNQWNLAKDQPPVIQSQQSAPNNHGGSQNHVPQIAFPMAQATQADVMRFVSNVIGSGLEAGAIKAPADIAKWAEAALKAANGVVAGKIEVPEFDDKIPF